MSESFFDHAPLSHGGRPRPATPDAAAAAVRGGLPARHFRTIVRDRRRRRSHLYADHFRWGPFGTVIAHLSLVVILVGALVGATFGFRNDGLAVAVGSTVDIGNGTGLTRRGDALRRLLLRERQPERLRQRPRRLQGRPAGRRGHHPGQRAAARRRRDPLPVVLRSGRRDEGSPTRTARSSSTRAFRSSGPSNDGKHAWSARSPWPMPG